MKHLLDLLDNLHETPFEQWPKSIRFRAVSTTSSGHVRSALITYKSVRYYIYYHHKDKTYVVEHN